jgi:hypothetical protein
MLLLAFLTSIFAGMLGGSAPQGDEQTPVLKGELKDAPPQGKGEPAILCEGTTNLPDGVVLMAYLYYDRIDDGREIAKDTPTVKGGKFSPDFIPFPQRQKNLAGKYIARFRFRPELQNRAITGWAPATVEMTLEIGSARDAAADQKAVRTQLADEIRAFTALGDEVKAKSKELKGRPAAAWETSIKEWCEKTTQIQARAVRTAEYRVLRLDNVADAGLEDLTAILISAARHAAAGKTDDAFEGIARLRQTAQFWIEEIASPKLTEPSQILELIESARALLKDALGRPDDQLLPARRKFVEMSALLQKSLPQDYQAALLDIGASAVTYFTAIADKQPGAKDLQKELDQQLEKLIASLRRPKGS